MAWRILKRTLRGFLEDRATRLSAALAFYAIFSLAPLLIIVVAVAGAAFGQEAVSGRLEQDLRAFVGRDSARTIQSMVESAHRPADSAIAAAVGLATLLFGASGVFAQIRNALNVVWHVPARELRGFRQLVVGRFLSFAMVLCFGFLLLVSLVIAALLNGFHETLSARLPLPGTAWLAIHAAVSLLVVAAIFALIYRIMPDAAAPWRDVLRGGLLAAVLFTAGKQLLGIYLGRESTASAYGAAGSVIVILMWVYFSAATLLIGAEFMKAWKVEHAPGLGAEGEPAFPRKPGRPRRQPALVG